MERRHVRLVGSHSAPGIQPSRAGARRFYFATARTEEFRESLARTLQSTATYLVRLRNHGKSGPRPCRGGQFRLERYRKLESGGELFREGQTRKRGELHD